MTSTETRYILNKKAKQDKLEREVRLVYRGVAYKK